jgi:hypothetical protein
MKVKGKLVASKTRKTVKAGPMYGKNPKSLLKALQNMDDALSGGGHALRTGMNTLRKQGEDVNHWEDAIDAIRKAANEIGSVILDVEEIIEKGQP